MPSPPCPCRTLWDALGALVADASLGVALAARADLAAILQRLEDQSNNKADNSSSGDHNGNATADGKSGSGRGRSSGAGVWVDDDEAALREAVEAAGGVDALVRNPCKVDELAAHLTPSSHITLAMVS